MIKYRFRNANILFIGINPHPGSFRRGVPFSNNKSFWYLLAAAGLVREPVEDLRDDKKLERIYRTKFGKVYKLGLVNIIDRPTRDVTRIRKGEEKPGRERLLRILRSYKPRVACFIGKVSYQVFSGKKDVVFGWHKRICSSKIFVMHFPIRGEASVRIKELRRIKAGARSAS